jgi:hypothetical protein
MQQHWQYIQLQHNKPLIWRDTTSRKIFQWSCICTVKFNITAWKIYGLFDKEGIFIQEILLYLSRICNWYSYSNKSVNQDIVLENSITPPDNMVLRSNHSSTVFIFVLQNCLKFYLIWCLQPSKWNLKLKLKLNVNWTDSLFIFFPESWTVPWYN